MDSKAEVNQRRMVPAVPKKNLMQNGLRSTTDKKEKVLQLSLEAKKPALQGEQMVEEEVEIIMQAVEVAAMVMPVATAERLMRFAVFC